MREIRQAARALRRHSERSVKYHRKESHFAIVRRVDPLSVELTGSKLVLDDDDLTISQGVRKYELQHGLTVGDTVVVIPIGQGDYVLVDVVSKKHTFEGADTTHTPGSGYIGGGAVTGGGGGTVQGTAIIGSVPYYDKDGNVIGRLPLLPP